MCSHVQFSFFGNWQLSVLLQTQSCSHFLCLAPFDLFARGNGQKSPSHLLRNFEIFFFFLNTVNIFCFVLVNMSKADGQTLAALSDCSLLLVLHVCFACVEKPGAVSMVHRWLQVLGRGGGVEEEGKKARERTCSPVFITNGKKEKHKRLRPLWSLCRQLH